MSSAAVIIAGVTAAAAVGGTAYTMLSSANRQSQPAAPAPQPMQTPAVPEPVAPAEPVPVPTKAGTAPAAKAEAPDAARGAQGTMLTGGLGVSDEVTTKKKTLLGA